MVGRETRLVVAAAVMLVISGCGAGADSEPRASEPTRETPSASESATDHASTHGNVKAPKPRPLRQGEDRVTLTMDAPYTPSRADRGRHRRLPLLPARPEAREGQLPHRHQRAARQPRRGPPRDPLPRSARAGGEGRGARRGRGRRGLDLLRRSRHRRVQQRRRRALARRLGARWSRVGAPTRATASRWPRARRSSCRCTTTCSPAPTRTCPRPSCGSRPRLHS